jgi:hypothetical protein
LMDLDSILSDLGMSLSDFDAGILDAEWTTVLLIV